MKQTFPAHRLIAAGFAIVAGLGVAAGARHHFAQEASRVDTPAWTQTLSVEPAKYQCRIGVNGERGKWYDVNSAVSDQFTRMGSLAWDCAIRGPDGTVCTWAKAGSVPRICTRTAAQPS